MTDFQRMSKGIPAVSDRMLLEMANGVTVARDMGSRSNGFFGRMLRSLNGSEVAGTNQALLGLADGQQTMASWLTELTESTTVTQLALARTRRDVVLTVKTLNRMQGALGKLSDDVGQLARIVAETVEEFEGRIDSLERRAAVTELQIRASESFSAVVDSWMAGTTYSDLPWPIQLALVARELASGPCGTLEHLTGQKSYRLRLINCALQYNRTVQALNGRFALARLLDRTSAEIDSPDGKSMAAELLDSGLRARLALPPRPLTTTMMTALELAALPSEARPDRAGVTALDLTRRRMGPLDGSSDEKTFINCVVHEQADAAAEMRVSLEITND